MAADRKGLGGKDEKHTPKTGLQDTKDVSKKALTEAKEAPKISLIDLTRQFLDAKEFNQDYCDIDYEIEERLSTLTAPEQKSFFNQIIQPLENKFAKEQKSITSSELIILGYAHANGIASKNPAKATGYYDAATKRPPKNPIAFLRLGLIYEKNRQYKEAAKCYEEAAALKNTHATIDLAHMYQIGQGVPQNTATSNLHYKESIPWLKHMMVIRPKYPMYPHSLAMIYRNVPEVRDQKKSLQYLLQAINRSSYVSVAHLATWHANGENPAVKKDLAKAAILFRLAFDDPNKAYQSNVEAFFNFYTNNPVVDYHAGITFRNRHLLLRSIDKDPEQFLYLFLDDLNPSEDLAKTNWAGIPLDPKFLKNTIERFREQVYETMIEFFASDNTDKEVFHAIRAQIGIRAMEKEDSRGLACFFNLNPAYLSVKENFQIGFLLMHHVRYGTPEIHKLLKENLLTFIDKLTKNTNEIQNDLLNIAYQFLRCAAQNFHAEAKKFLVDLVLELSPTPQDLREKLYAQSFSFPKRLADFKTSILLEAEQILLSRSDKNSDYQTLKQHAEDAKDEKRSNSARQSLVDTFCERHTILNNDAKKYLYEQLKTQPKLPESFDNFSILLKKLLRGKFSKEQLYQGREEEGLKSLGFFNKPVVRDERHHPIINNCMQQVKVIFDPYKQFLIGSIGTITLADSKAIVDPEGLSRNDLQKIDFLWEIHSYLENITSNLINYPLQPNDLKQLSLLLGNKLKSSELNGFDHETKKELTAVLEKMKSTLDQALSQLSPAEAKPDTKKPLKK